MVTIKQVETKKELKQFIRFNYELYKDNPYSVPDLYEDMLDTFSDKNPACSWHHQQQGKQGLELEERSVRMDRLCG